MDGNQSYDRELELCLTRQENGIAMIFHPEQLISWLTTETAESRMNAVTEALVVRQIELFQSLPHEGSRCVLGPL